MTVIRFDFRHGLQVCGNIALLTIIIVGDVIVFQLKAIAGHVEIFMENFVLGSSDVVIIKLKVVGGTVNIVDSQRVRSLGCFDIYTDQNCFSVFVPHQVVLGISAGRMRGVVVNRGSFGITGPYNLFIAVPSEVGNCCSAPCTTVKGRRNGTGFSGNLINLKLSQCIKCEGTNTTSVIPIVKENGLASQIRSCRSCGICGGAIFVNDLKRDRAIFIGICIGGSGASITQLAPVGGVHVKFCSAVLVLDIQNFHVVSNNLVISQVNIQPVGAGQKLPSVAVVVTGVKVTDSGYFTATGGFIISGIGGLLFGTAGGGVGFSFVQHTYMPVFNLTVGTGVTVFLDGPVGQQFVQISTVGGQDIGSVAISSKGNYGIGGSGFQGSGSQVGDPVLNSQVGNIVRIKGKQCNSNIVSVGSTNKQSGIVHSVHITIKGNSRIKCVSFSTLGDAQRFSTNIFTVFGHILDGNGTGLYQSVLSSFQSIDRSNQLIQSSVGVGFAAIRSRFDSGQLVLSGGQRGLVSVPAFVGVAVVGNSQTVNTAFLQGCINGPSLGAFSIFIELYTSRVG